MSPRSPAGERGAAALTGILSTLALLAVLLPGLLAVADLMATARRAGAAADAAALAVLAGSRLAGGSGVPDTASGANLARANGATLVSIDAEGWPVAVTVTVAARPAGLLTAVLGELTADAAARLAPP